MTKHELCHYFFIIIYCGIYIISDRNYKTLNIVKTIKGIINDTIFFTAHINVENICFKLVC